MVAKSIPASADVAIIPGVQGTGGSPLVLNGIIGTLSTRVPIGTVLFLAGLQAVQSFFGVNSIQAQMAAIYFGGYTGATRLPQSLGFAQYNEAAIGGYLRSGAGLTLTAIQALTGVLTVTIDGTPYTTASINLTSATSFSNAGALIQAALVTAGATGVTCTYDATLGEFVILSSTTGVNANVGFATGSLATPMLFTSATGAVLSPGAAAATPAGFIAMIQSQTLNWAGFATDFDPDNGAAGGPVKLAFAQAISAVSPAGDEAFFYAAEDTDVALATGPAPTSFPVLSAQLNGRYAIYTPATGYTYGLQSAFTLACAASTNWAQTNGRITYKFRNSPLLTPAVTDLTISKNLDANGCNYYAAVATRNAKFQYNRQGSVSGAWDWMDEYVGQIYFNSQCQLALITFAQSVTFMPYVDPTYAQLRGVLKAPITEALNNGTIVKGVTLSSAQVQALIQATGGVDISSTLFAQGWYLQILDPGAPARGERTTPNMTLWYTDGGSIQQINMASIDIQ